MLSEKEDIRFINLIFSYGNMLVSSKLNNMSEEDVQAIDIQSSNEEFFPFLKKMNKTQLKEIKELFSLYYKKFSEKEKEKDNSKEEIKHRLLLKEVNFYLNK